MLPTDLPERLARRLESPPPGVAAQRRFEPELSFGRHFHTPGAEARQAAVVMLLYRRDDQWRLPLVLRPMTMKAHAGQVALPGGTVDVGETSLQAALRELEEELGVPPSAVEIVGRLSPITLFVSGFAVTPWLATARSAPQLRPCADEVSLVLEPPLEQLMDPSRVETLRYRRGDVVVGAPSIRWEGRRIWGATAMMLGELIALLGDIDLNDSDPNDIESAKV